jgi:hypothetical protein
MDTSQKKSTPSTQQELKEVFSHSGEVSDGRADGSVSAKEGCTQRRRSSEERRESKGPSMVRRTQGNCGSMKKNCGTSPAGLSGKAPI